MCKYCLAACLSLLSNLLCAQGLNQHSALSFGGTGDDTTNAIAVDGQGNVYIGGTFKSPVFTVDSYSLPNAGGSDAFLIKMDNSSTILWAKRFGGAGNESITTVSVDASGFVYAAGPNFPLTKMDGTGNSLWQTSFSGDWTTIASDSRGNIYAGYYGGFSKFRSNGNFVYSRNAPYYIQAGDFSVDRQDNPHLFFHSSGGVLSDGLQSYNVNFATRAVYDSSGKITKVEQYSTNPRYYTVGYKAVDSNHYLTTLWYPTLNSSNTMFLNGVGYGNVPCYYKRPVNPEKGESNNLFFAGNFRPQAGCSPTFPGGPVLVFSPTNQVSAITGNDILYVHRTAAKDSGNTTFTCGSTNESVNRIVVDSIRHTLYIAGYWSKMADTAKFRFGSSVLTNAGNGATTDGLLLILKYSNTPLFLNAGFDQTICTGGAAQISTSVSGGEGAYTYSWSPAAGLSNSSVANPIARPTVSTSYVLTVTDATGNSVKDTVNVNINPSLYKPTISIAIGSNPFCEGQQIVLIASAAASYQWSNTPAGGQSNNGYTVTTTDTLTVTAINNEGCIGTSDPFIAVMKPRPAAPVITPDGNAQNTVQTCIGSTTTLTAQSNQNSVTYLWHTGSTSPAISTQTSGVFSVAVTGANGCTSPNALRSVVFYNLPAGNIIANGSTNLCSGDSVRLTVNTADSTAVLWNTGATTKSIWVKAAGLYSAQLRTTQGCTVAAANPVIVQVFTQPSVSIAQNGNTLTALPTAASYQWYLNNIAINGAIAQTLTVTTGGAYSVRVTTTDGCSAVALLGAVLRIQNASLTYQVYPNPATEKIGILYTLLQAAKVTVTLRSAQGHILNTVVSDRLQTAGDYQYNIPTTGLSKGIFYVQFIIGNKIISEKIMVL